MRGRVAVCIDEEGRIVTMGGAAFIDLEDDGLVDKARCCRAQKQKNRPRPVFRGADQKSLHQVDGHHLAAIIDRIMGWLMGLEPTTTGITIRDSTN